MTICDICSSHATIQSKKLINRDIYVKELPKHYIEKLSDDELLAIYKFVQDGITICRDCLLDCKLSGCKNNQIEIAKYYLTTGNLTQTQIEKEVQRRIILKKNLKNINKFVNGPIYFGN